MTKICILIIFVVLSILSGVEHCFAQSLCADLFTHSQAISDVSIQPSRLEPQPEVYKKSDLSPRPQVWLRIRQALQKGVSHLQHPLEIAGQNPDKIGAVYKAMVNELPLLATLIKIEQRGTISHPDFIRLKHLTANQLIAIARTPQSDLQVFAALEALRLLSTIEMRVEFPKSPEEIERDKKEKREAEKKKEEKKKKKDKEQQDNDQEEEPQWNKTQDKYKPENKDLASDGSGKKKNANIVMTDADAPKRLLRQKIYDQFDLKDWSSVPAQRAQVVKDANFTKKLIINPLGENEIDVPVPYGYSLIAGKYPDYQIIEVGPGEFKLRVPDKKPVVLGLAKMQMESHISGLPRPVPAQELAHWPPHLLMFAQSLKGLSAVDAAGRLEKYIAEDGGFLYYSKGDKIDEDELSQMDQKLQQLLTQMPKPMAMAQVGAFNCDGAAWIGALLLRDVLHHPVRIAAGRTSAGITRIEGVPHHVVRSADPAHAWLEVFDGKLWVPFDMTPKNNTPDSESSPSDLEREEPQKQNQKPNNQKQKEQKPDSKDSQKSENDSKDSETDSDKDEREKKENQPSKDGKDAKTDEDAPDKKDSEDGDEPDEAGRKIDEILKAKSTQRQRSESQISLVDKLLRRNELMALEHLIAEGYQTKFVQESGEILKALAQNPNWRSAAQRSADRISTQINDAKFIKFSGLQNLVSEARVEFAQNKPREAMQRLFIAQRFLIALSEYRNLTSLEVDALNSIQKILSELGAIKNKNSKEFSLVDDMLKDLPGNISKAWLRQQYGKDFDQLGSSANIKLAQDLAQGRLKPLLQMGAVSSFVDMTLNSSPEPRWKDEPTLNRSIMPKPRQDLIVTRNPLDFAKMLWNLRPGEHQFAPTLQGRQFAIGSLETRRIPNPKNPIERKVSVVYYDISGSMNGHPLETVDALLMAFADKALSETDAIGRPTHEIYLVPFDDKIYEGVHISSREDALNFISKRMNLRTQAAGGTDIQKVIENFYELISSSHKSKSAQGREKLFQKANMVLFSDGGSQIDMQRIEEARKKIPSSVEINMNFVSIGDQVNETLKTLSSNAKLSTNKPTFRQMTSEMISSVVNVSAQFDPDAFATTERISGAMLAQVQSLLQRVNIDSRQPPSKTLVERALSQVQITRQDVSQLSGLREALNLSKLKELVIDLKLDSLTKRRLFEAIVESYPQITGRSWKDMTYQERDALEDLRGWSHQ